MRTFVFYCERCYNHQRGVTMNYIDETDKKILKEFEQLPSGFWDFYDSSTDELIHGLHNYPAVMIYPISRTILNIVSKYRKINCLFDPFVGSGTVLVEGQIKNIPCVIGNDLNPLARLITCAKTTMLNDDDIDSLRMIQNKITKKLLKLNPIIIEFDKYIKSNYDISSKTGWANNAEEMTNKFLHEKNIKLVINNPFKNLGYWFSPSTIIPLQIIKNEVALTKGSKINAMLNCAFSELVRFVSNTRNSEFKLYRMKKEKVYDIFFDVEKEFNRILEKNIGKMQEYVKNINSNSIISVYSEDAQLLDSIKDESVDIVITSPPYGDSHTTVAYGQFSKLSSQWLGLIENENIDALLLGGRKQKNYNIKSLKSAKLESTINRLLEIDKKRANEVLSFYCDLDKTIEKIAIKTKKNGYQFWVVGNRTVKKTLLETDVIISELAEKYGLKLLRKDYRKISNKVMPLLNSPTNVAGDTITTMANEIILFFKKI